MASDHSYGDHAATSDRVALSCRRLPVSGWRVGFLDPHDQLRVIVWRFDREQQHLADYYEPGENGAKPESLYGSVKMWAHLQREGIPVAKSTVERLMRANGWQGVRRQKTVRPTIPDPAAQRAPDLVDREFTVPAPNRFLLADFTYVKLLTGTFAYVAFVIDAFAGTIIGWEPPPARRPDSWSPRSAKQLRCGHGRGTRSTARYTTRTRALNIRLCTSARRCRCPVCGPRSGRSATRSTVRMSATGRWPDSCLRLTPRFGCPGC